MNQLHQTTDQVEIVFRHKTSLFPVPSSAGITLPSREGVWVWSSQPSGRWRNCLQLRWEYFIRLPTNGVHWILICQQSTDKKRRKSLNRTSCKVSSGISVFLVNSQLRDDKLPRATERALKQDTPLVPPASQWRLHGRREPGSGARKSVFQTWFWPWLLRSPPVGDVTSQSLGYSICTMERTHPIPPKWVVRTLGRFVCHPDRRTKSCLWNYILFSPLSYNSMVGSIS